MLKAMQILSRAMWKYLKNLQNCWKPCTYHAEPCENTRNIAQESSDLLNAMQIPRRATWKYVKYRSGVFRPVESHANTMQSHMKIRGISLKNVQNCWKPCKYHAEPCENTWNINQESSHLLKAMQIPRRATWKYVKYPSRIFTHVESHANTT